MFLDNTQTNYSMFIYALSKRIRTTEPITFTYGQFVHYIHRKVCRYRVFNIFA